jgi:hypothetical protein
MKRGWTLAAMLALAVPIDAGQARSLFNGRDLSGWEHVGKGGSTSTTGS